HVGGVGVETNKPGHLNVHPRLLLDLANHRVLDALPYVVASPGQRPQVVIGAMHQEQAAIRHNDRGHGWNDGVGLRGVGVVEVVLAHYEIASDSRLASGTEVAQTASKPFR